MTDAFDPYRKWLGIPPEEQPPHHYRLLSLRPFEDDRDVIETAADRLMAQLRTFQTGKHVAESQRLLNEVAASKMCLLNPERKAAYDKQLRQKLQAPADSGFDSGLAALLETGQPAAMAKPARPKTKTSTSRAPIYAAAVIGGVLLLGPAIWAVSRTGGSQESTQAERPPASASVAEAKAGRPGEKKPEGSPAPQASTPVKPAVVTPPAAPALTLEKPEPSANPSTAPSAEPKPGDLASQTPPAPQSEPTAKAEPADQAAPAAPEKPQRQPVPKAAVQQEIVSQVDEVYKLHDARKPAQQIKLAKDLLESAEKATKPEERFVMLRKAAELAGEADDAALMFQAIDRLAAQFEMDSLAVKEKLLAKLASAAKDSERIKSLVEGSNTLIDLALAEDRFDMALELATTALRVCQKTQGAPFRKSLIESRKEIQALKKQSEQIAQALEAVQANPQDADANLIAGRWFCFTKGDWANGLPYLAKGSDEGLKTLAVQETGSPPSEAEQQVKLANAWWDAGQEAKGKARAAILLHSGMWYQQAQPNLAAGLGKAQVEKRLKEIAALGREIPAPPGKQPPLAVAPFDEKKALVHQKRWAKFLGVSVVQTNSIGMKLVLIPPGEFDMGSSKELIEEELRLRGDDPTWHVKRMPGEGPQHRVRITKPYWLGATEVTQEEYQRVMGNNPSKIQGDLKRPVEKVSWDDAVEFCRKLSELPAETGARRQYVLPTEAQWEYACRAGSAGPWCFSPHPGPLSAEAAKRSLGEYAWFNATARGTTHPVAQKQASVWGLYDMHGNLWEWCQDWYDQDYYAKSPTDDPTGPPEGSDRVSRGGGWDFPARLCRSALRFYNVPGYRTDFVGFRVSQVPANK